MAKSHLIIPDPHAHPDVPNDRADWIGRLILDTRPDVVVNLGDMWDFPSLSSYEKGQKSFWGRAYHKDLKAGLDFDRRLWAPIREAKRRHPFKVFIEGNHENRLKRLLQLQPELDGTVSFEDLGLRKNYDVIVEYTGTNTPGLIEIDGILYSHFVISGVQGRALSSIHLGYNLIQKKHCSVTVGHNHTFSYDVQNTGSRTLHGLCAGTLQTYVPEWAGEVAHLWRHGVILKHDVHDGDYDLEWISLARLKREYGDD
jgi:hypothetical protein